MPKKISYDEIKRRFAEKGFELLTTEYKNNRTPMKCKCSNGHIIMKTADTLKNKCYECVGGVRLTYIDVKKGCLEKGFELLDTEYKNSSTPMQVKCSNGHVTSKTWDSIKQGSGCSKCVGVYSPSLEEVKQEFLDNGCELLEEEYTNSATPMKYKCECENISYICRSSFLTGVRCKQCGDRKKAQAFKHDYQYVKEYFQSYNCELLEKEYINSGTFMKYKCYCGKIHYTRFEYFKQVQCLKHNVPRIDDLKESFLERGFTLLTKRYTHNEQNLEYLCPEGHLSTITYVNFRAGKGCGKCKNKTEKRVFDYLKEYFPTIEHQKKFDWCPKRPFDFVFENYKLILEVDGLQHFKQVSNWQSPEKTQQRDFEKMKLAFQNGYKILRISQNDIMNHTSFPQLLHIPVITQQLTYIANDNIYDDYHQNFIHHYCDL